MKGWKTFSTINKEKPNKKGGTQPMKLNFDFQFYGLDKKKHEGDQFHAGKNLADALSAFNKGHSTKFTVWALKIWNKEPIELDESDYQILHAFIETTEFLTALAKYQLHEIMEASKQKSLSKAK
jgi:hypothetical protein